MQIALIIAIGFLAGITTHQVTSRTEFTWNGHPFHPIGFNYFTKYYHGYGFWVNYNETEIRADLAIIKQLGGNCLRTFIPWHLFEPVMGIYDESYVDRLVSFYNLASEYDVAIICAFFDNNNPAWLVPDADAMYTNQAFIAAQAAHLQHLIARISNTKAAFAWELGSRPESNTVSIGAFLDYLSTLRTSIQAIDTSHYIIIGDAYGNFRDPYAFSKHVDAICVAYYKDINEPAWEDTFKNYITYLQGTGKPVLLEEFGAATWNTTTEARQAEYYQTVLRCCDQAHVAGALAWCLRDYMPVLWKESERHMGVIRVDGTWKAAAFVFQEYVARNAQ